LINTAVIEAGPDLLLTRSASLLVNSWQVYLPIVSKNF
jgi:hypothetical protein